MSRTPLRDFLEEYAGAGTTRLHMPGHKGRGGFERYDITEIPGADVLYRAEGVIRSSEENAAAAFGSARTLYSAEGCTLAIRAMLFLAAGFAAERGIPPVILAVRNVHSSFVTTAAMLDLGVAWLLPEKAVSGLSFTVTPGELDAAIRRLPSPPAAVYVTSPDYLGKTQNIAALAPVCREYGVPLLVDGAHGAYLRFLEKDRHPLSLGADMVAESAHKTLPVLTGGAYLHISETSPPFFRENAERAFRFFASTSPSYLILRSLDAVNGELSGGFREAVAEAARRVALLKRALQSDGWALYGDEPLKVTLRTKPRGYPGVEVQAALAESGVVAEFADPDYVTLMFSPRNGGEDYGRLYEALRSLPRKPPILEPPPRPVLPPARLSVREAVLSPSVALPPEAAVGRVLADIPAVCPPAVPVAAPGETVTAEVASAMRYYGYTECRVARL